MGRVPYRAAAFDDDGLRGLMPHLKRLSYGVGYLAVFNYQDQAAIQAGVVAKELLELIQHRIADRAPRAMLENEYGFRFRTFQELFQILLFPKLDHHGFRLTDPPGTRSGELPSKEITDDLDLLLRVTPPYVQDALRRQPDLKSLVEVVMDLGRQPEARFPDRAMYLSDQMVTREDLDYVTHRVGSFTQDNRAGIERTLHRISGIRNRREAIVGLT